MSSSSVSAPSRSFLLPRISKGIPCSVGQSSNVCKLRLDSSIVARSTESTTKIMQSAYRQYFSQLSLKRSWPPRSHTEKETLPLRTRLKLNPIVGIESSSNSPVARVFVSVDLPAFYNPIMLISSSRLQSLE